MFSPSFQVGITTLTGSVVSEPALLPAAGRTSLSVGRIAPARRGRPPCAVSRPIPGPPVAAGIPSSRPG